MFDINQKPVNTFINAYSLSLKQKMLTDKAINVQNILEDSFKTKRILYKEPSVFEKIQAFFSRNKRDELIKKELIVFGKNEVLKYGLNPDKFRMIFVDKLVKADASIDVNNAAVIMPTCNFKDMSKTKRVLVHEIKHMHQHFLIANLPIKDIQEYNKLTLQMFVFKDMDEQTKNLLLKISMNDINDKFIHDYIKKHPNSYSIEDESDMFYAKRDFKGFKMLLENPEISIEELPMAFNYKSFKELRANKSLSQKESLKARLYINSLAKHVDNVYKIKSNKNLSLLEKEEALWNAYISNVMEQEAFDEAFDYLSKNDESFKEELDSYKHLKQKNHVNYYKRFIR